MNIYNARMRFFYFCGLVWNLAWSIVFSLCVFTMVQDKIFKSENIYKILTKILCDGDKTIFLKMCYIYNSTIDTKENLPIIIPAISID